MTIGQLFVDLVRLVEHFRWHFGFKGPVGWLFVHFKVFVVGLVKYSVRCCFKSNLQSEKVAIGASIE